MIYRVEDEHGRGPYTQGCSYALTCGNRRRHPSPQAEGYNLSCGSAEVFGFASREQLERWFDPEDLEELAKAGYDVVEYDVEPHWQSETQCTFFKP